MKQIDLYEALGVVGYFISTNILEFLYAHFKRVAATIPDKRRGGGGVVEAEGMKNSKAIPWDKDEQLCVYLRVILRSPEPLLICKLAGT